MYRPDVSISILDRNDFLDKIEAIISFNFKYHITKPNSHFIELVYGRC